MNIIEQIAIMKAETRIANRGMGEGIKNWTPEARAKSLAVRRAKGSIWGWDKRKGASTPSYTTEAFERSMEALDEDAEKVRKTLELHRKGIPTIGPRSAYADEIARQRIESFKAWLAEVKRVEGAIDDFNGIVAALGGMTSGAARAQRGKQIGELTRPPVKKPVDPKVPVEKSIRRNYEKRNADYLKKNPDERATMLDMVAEKAEYYAATPAEKIAIEKGMYRQVKNEGAMNLREKAPKVDYLKQLEAKREAVREREEIKKQLFEDEIAYPIGNGSWLGILRNGDQRIIGTESSMGNRKHSEACASSKGEECNCSCGGSMHGGGSGDNEGESKTPADSVSEQAHESKDENGVKGMTEEERLALIGELESKTEKGQKLEASETKMLADLKKASSDWNKLLNGFSKMIGENKRPSLQNLVAQLDKDNDTEKYKMAVDALSEAYHTKSLDQFQDKFGRDPRNNKEFRDFQKKIKVPIEFIGD